MKDLNLVAANVIEYYKGNKLVLSEEDILEVVLENGCSFEDVDGIIKILMEEFKFAKLIHNKEDVDCFGDGHVYTPTENQDCNDMEEWVYAPTMSAHGALPTLTQEDIESLLN